MINEYETLIREMKNKIETLNEMITRCNSAFINIIERTRDGILIFDEHGKVIYTNPAALDLFGKTLEDLLGENMGVFIETNQKTEITIIHKDRGPIIIEVNIADTSWNNQPAKLASLRDVTEHYQTKRILERLSHFDFLTDLSNRVYFEETLKKSLARSDRIEQRVALLFLDMDGFKKVNDTYGHQIGDQLLIKAASLLKASVRAEDLVSRLGGDEFAIILERINKITYSEQVAQKILEMIGQPITIDKCEVHVNFSIGIAIYPDHAKTIDELIQKADSAMYRAKKAGKGRYCFYSN